MSGFIDIHHHFVYGIDDGPRDAATMEKMLNAAAQDGTIGLVATPHITPGVKPFNYVRYHARLLMAQAYCSQAGLPLRLYAGAEILYTPHLPRYLAEGQILTMAGSKYVLVEFAPSVTMNELNEAVLSILRSGYYPLIAHVERYPALIKNPQSAMRLKEVGNVVFQMNASAIVDPKGFFLARQAAAFLKHDLVDCIASDAHNTTTRSTSISKAYAILKAEYGDALADKLTGRNGLVFLNRMDDNWAKAAP